MVGKVTICTDSHGRSAMTEQEADQWCPVDDVGSWPKAVVNKEGSDLHLARGIDTKIVEFDRTDGIMRSPTDGLVTTHNEAGTQGAAIGTLPGDLADAINGNVTGVTATWLKGESVIYVTDKAPPPPEWHYPSAGQAVALALLVAVLVLKRRVARWARGLVLR